MPDIVGKLKPPRLTTAPSSPVVGELYYNTANNTLYWWNGTTWISASGGASGPFVDFIGTWASGTAYKGGDVVRYNNNDYIAVNPSTGQVPPDPSIPANLAGAPLVTSLPTSPFSGQEVVLVDSLTNPSYNWRFRYNAASTSGYKWEFVGGAPLVGRSDATQTLNTGAWVNLVAATIALPRTGDYIVQGLCTVTHPTAGSTSYAGVYINTPATMGPYGQFGFPVAGGYSGNIAAGPWRWNGLTGGQGVGMAGQTNVNGGTFSYMNWSILPVRVS